MSLDFCIIRKLNKALCADLLLMLLMNRNILRNHPQFPNRMDLLLLLNYSSSSLVCAFVCPIHCETDVGGAQPAPNLEWYNSGWGTTFAEHSDPKFSRILADVCSLARKLWGRNFSISHDSAAPKTASRHALLSNASKGRCFVLLYPLAYMLLLHIARTTIRPISRYCVCTSSDISFWAIRTARRWIIVARRIL